MRHPWSRPGTQLAVGAVCWILALQNLIAEPIVAAAWPTSYSFSENAISDLGITSCGPFELPDGSSAYVCSPRHALMNGSFVAFGLLVIAGAILTRRAWPRRRSTTVGLTLVGLAGAGVIVIGLVPANVTWRCTASPDSSSSCVRTPPCLYSPSRPGAGNDGWRSSRWYARPSVWPRQCSSSAGSTSAWAWAGWSGWP